MLDFNELEIREERLDELVKNLPGLLKYKRETNLVDLEESYNILNINSKFGGQPYLENESDWPKDSDGEFMYFICQINFEEMPYLENFPKKGILEFFMSPKVPKDGYLNEHRFKYFSDPKNTKSINFLAQELAQGQQKENNKPNEVNIYNLNFILNDEYKIDFHKVEEYMAYQDVNFPTHESSDMNEKEEEKRIFGGKTQIEYFKYLGDDEDDYTRDLINHDRTKIGGYASFWQTDPRAYGNDKGNRRDHVHVMQIAAIPDFIETHWGGEGIMHFFIDPEDLKNNKLDKCWFQFDI